MDTATHPALADSPLKQHLRSEGRQQKWLSEQTGIRPDRLSRIVQGLIPESQEAVAIADALGLDIPDLWTLAGGDEE